MLDPKTANHPKGRDAKPLGLTPGSPGTRQQGCRANTEPPQGCDLAHGLEGTCSEFFQGIVLSRCRRCTAALTILAWRAEAIAAQRTLTWVGNSVDETGFSVERSTGGAGVFAESLPRSRCSRQRRAAAPPVTGSTITAFTPRPAPSSISPSSEKPGTPPPLYVSVNSVDTGQELKATLRKSRVSV